LFGFNSNVFGTTELSDVLLNVGHVKFENSAELGSRGFLISKNRLINLTII
jgi:hypothetical protein